MSAARVRVSTLAASPGAAGPIAGPLVTVEPLDEGFVAEVTDPDNELGWQGRALCAQTDPEAFYPEKGGSTRDGKKVCRSCEVRAECLEYALANDERFGIWGGMSERERRRLKREGIEGEAV